MTSTCRTNWESYHVDSIMYHDGNRRLQDRFDGSRIADRLEEKLTRTQFTPDDKTFIESAPCFFLATADDEGRQIALTTERPALFALPDLRSSHFLTMTVTACSKASAISWSVPASGCCSLPCHSKPRRLRVNGEATVNDHDPLLDQTVGAQLIVRVLHGRSSRTARVTSRPSQFLQICKRGIKDQSTTPRPWGLLCLRSWLRTGDKQDDTFRSRTRRTVDDGFGQS